MRNIGTLKSAQQGVAFGRLLDKNGIKNQIEVIRVDDPIDSMKHSYQCHIWIYDEDQVDKAEFLMDQFAQEEHNPLIQEDLTLEEEHQQSTRGKWPITLFFIFLCTLFFVISDMTEPEFTKVPSNPLIAVPLTSSPIKRQLMYDWPNIFNQSDELIEKYGVDKLINPQELPESAKLEYIKLNREPVWFGIYPYLIHRNIPYNSDTLFQSIREGEVWRLFTPALIHYDIFHIFFNMLWLFYLGKMLESTLNKKQYLLLILIAGVVTNTAQYLMTGPNFLGYSGILTAYMGFIWMRQKIAPWEGYPLTKSVIQFMGIFIFGMLGISVLSFITELFFNISIAPGIANTAHVTGIFLGILLAKMPFFKASKI